FFARKENFISRKNIFFNNIDRQNLLSTFKLLTTLYSFPNMKPVRFQMFPANFLNLPLRRDILNRAVVYEADNLRQGTACKKNRADVRGSNRKIRPQKGTGRARLGDIRSPTIRGGGLAHAPKPRDFSTKLPRKIYYLAMRTALSARYKRGQIIVINHTFELPTHKTRAMVDVMKIYGWDSNGGGTVFIMYADRKNFIHSTGNLGKHCIVRNNLSLQSSSGFFKDSSENNENKAKYPRLTYVPPKLGVNEAYDEALKVIEADRLEKLKKIKRIQRRIEQKMKDSNAKNKNAQLADLKKHLNQLEILADINNPEIRWRFKNNDVDMTIPVYRYLAKQKWMEKPYHLLMQRIEQMYVIPDAYERFKPVAEVLLRFNNEELEPGKFVSNNISASEPVVEINSFSGKEKMYTIVLVDLDVPDLEKDSFKTYLHWIVSNILISPGNTLVKPSSGNILVPYIPPHPQKGSLYHRYTLLVFEQAGRISNNSVIERDRFDVRQFASLNYFKIVGINFWRGIWDEHVDKIMLAMKLPPYKTMLKRC
ncbi:hypothetical protein PORY_002513, partial [Pneumocystis oryctolagi]